MNIILYGIPDDTAELIAGRYDLELIHSIEEIGACGTLLPVPKITAVAGSLQRPDASRGCDRCSHHLRVRNLRCGRHDMLRGSSGKNLHTLRRSGRRRAGSGVIPAARCHLHASQPNQPLKRRIPEKTKGILFSNFFRHEFAPTFSAFAKNPLERISTTGCHLATGLAHESKYTPLRF